MDFSKGEPKNSDGSFTVFLTKTEPQYPGQSPNYDGTYSIFPKDSQPAYEGKMVFLS